VIFIPSSNTKVRIALDLQLIKIIPFIKLNVNHCHNPAGGSDGGQFCSDSNSGSAGGSFTPLKSGLKPSHLGKGTIGSEHKRYLVTKLIEEKRSMASREGTSDEDKARLGREADRMERGLNKALADKLRHSRNAQASRHT